MVTRDVAAYTIVAGSPARMLRPRFAPEIAARIEALAWWDWPQERLFEAVPDMQRLPIEAVPRPLGRMSLRAGTGKPVHRVAADRVAIEEDESQ